MPPEADAPEAAARVRVKICGITRAEDLQAAVSAGADYVGFVFFPRSPRNVTIDAAAALAAMVPPGVRRVGLTVDASDALLGAITARVALDMLQLHGHEPPARAAEVRVRYGLSVMKAVGIAGASDLPLLDAYQGAADQVLVDARPPEGAPLPGGNGLAFDWRLLAGRKWRQPWMLAGGLTPDNVAEAIRRTGVRQVDVSSGVEAAPGLKDPTLLAAFIAAAQSAAAASGPR